MFQFQRTYKIKMNTNGQKVLSIKPIRARGFSICTNGSLPSWHRLPLGTLVIPHTKDNKALFHELVEYIHENGTERQKALFAKNTE